LTVFDRNHFYRALFLGRLRVASAAEANSQFPWSDVEVSRVIFQHDIGQDGAHAAAAAGAMNNFFPVRDRRKVTLADDLKSACLAQGRIET
jgi:hypothetical protein